MTATPSSSSGEEDKSNRMDYNDLLLSKNEISSSSGVDSGIRKDHQSALHSTGGSKSTESLDFEEVESIIWRKHHLRRFFQDRGVWWTASRQTVAWRLGLLGLGLGLELGLKTNFRDGLRDRV
jgi:hypothetical protein